MAGGSRSKQQQRMKPQEIIASLHEAAGEDGTYDLSRDDFLDQSRELNTVMGVTGNQFEILGVQSIRHNGNDLNLQDVRRNERRGRANTREVEKELSYTLKKSKQEELAIKRGEYQNYDTNRDRAAEDAISLYARYQFNPASVRKKGRVQMPSGNEFLQMPGDTDTVIAARIFELMRSRKLLADQVNAMKKIKDIRPEEKVLLAYYKRQLACTDDAIYTWNISNGVDPDKPGSPVSQKTRDKARHHLPLALEKYKYECTTGKAILGRQIIEKVRKSKQWKTDEALEDSRRLADDALSSRVHGIDGSFRFDMDKLQTYITGHPDTYKKYQKKVDEAFDLFTQRLRRASVLRWNTYEGQAWLWAEYGKGKPQRFKSRIDEALTDMTRYDAEEIAVLMYQAESARDYIHFLLSDGAEKTDIMHGQYIEKVFGVTAYDQDPKLPLCQTQAEFRSVERDFEARLHELDYAIKHQNDPVLKARLQHYYDKLVSSKDDNPVDKAGVLAAVDDNMMRMDNMHDLLTEHVSVPGEMKNPGFRGIVRSFTGIGQDLSMTLEEAMQISDDMIVVKTGKNWDSTDADQSAQDQALGRLLSAYTQQVAGLEAYIQNNPEVLRDRMPQNLFNDWRKLPEFENKAQAVLGGMTVIINSPLFLNLPPAQQTAATDDFIKVTAMYTAANETLSIIKRESQKTTEEYVRNPVGLGLFRTAYSDQLRVWTQIIPGQLRGYQRTFAPFPKS